MTSDEERLQILKMIEEGQITAEEAAKLLDALEEPRTSEAQTGAQARWFRVRVTDLNTGKHKVNINLPLKLVDLGAKLGARFAAPADLNVDEIIQAIREGAEGKIVDVEDQDENERIEVYVE
jgi:hypothetical protein